MTYIVKMFKEMYLIFGALCSVFMLACGKQGKDFFLKAFFQYLQVFHGESNIVKILTQNHRQKVNFLLKFNKDSVVLTKLCLDNRLLWHLLKYNQEVCRGVIKEVQQELCRTSQGQFRSSLV